MLHHISRRHDLYLEVINSCKTHHVYNNIGMITNMIKVVCIPIIPKIPTYIKSFINGKVNIFNASLINIREKAIKFSKISLARNWIKKSFNLQRHKGYNWQLNLTRWLMDPFILPRLNTLIVPHSLDWKLIYKGIWGPETSPISMTTISIEVFWVSSMALTWHSLTFFKSALMNPIPMGVGNLTVKQ